MIEMDFTMDEFYVYKKILEIEVGATRDEIKNRGQYYTASQRENMERYLHTLEKMEAKVASIKN